MTTRYIDNSKLVAALGMEPGEAYEQTEECHTDITHHQYKGRAFEVYYDQMAGPLSQWKAWGKGIGFVCGNLERQDTIDGMRKKIDDNS